MVLFGLPCWVWSVYRSYFGRFWCRQLDQDKTPQLLERTGGFSLEDLVVVTKSGYEKLTDYPRDHRVV